ncbi:ABC transporter substrate-binding protein [Paenibacillus koleovorans]|uniref:ABC transporter substrate-binding protein n=1 Tax=Paenibacillus koleovorans TaxID=121608 RepID=UPI000FD71BC2|nr:ABC transporter substrate-binding protein [Paenibacillus koleovorans]
MKQGAVWCGLMAALLLVGVVGCSSGNGEGEAQPSGSAAAQPSTSAKPFEKTLEISWLGGGGTEIKDNNRVQQKIEKMFNVKIKNTKIDNQNNDQMSLMINSGEMPDAVFYYGDAVKLFNDGVSRSIPKEALLKNAPNYAKMLDANPIGWKMNLAKGKTDEFIALTGLAEQQESLQYLSMYRLDWLEKLNLVPKVKMQQLDKEGRIFFSPESITLEQLETILKAFTFNDPDGNGKKDTFGVAASNDRMSGWVSLMGAYGIAPAGNAANAPGYNKEVNGQLVEWNILPQYKEFLKKMAAWYKDGVIDPEFPTLNTAKQWEKTTGGITGYFQTNYNYVDPTAKTYAARPPMSVLNNNPKAKILIMAPEKGPNGFRGVSAKAPVTSLTYQMVISKKVDDEKLARILQIIDYLNFNKEGVIWSQFGEAGVDFNWEAEPNNSRPLLLENVNPKQEGLGYYNHSIATLANLKFNFGEIPRKLLDWTLFGEGKDLKIRPYKWDYFNTTNLSSVQAQYGAGLKTITDEFFFQSIIGEVDVDKGWDSYVDKWKKAGGSKLMEELEKAPKVADLLVGK